MNRLRGMKWLTAAVLALALTACGDDDETNNGNPPVEDAGDVTSDAATDGGSDAGTDAADATDASDTDDQDATDGGDDASDGGDDASDGGDDATDGGEDATDGGTDGGDDASQGAMPDPNAAAQITTAVGGTDTTISGAAVTYLLPSDAGFFVQATQDGPAILVSVDPTSTTPEVNVGDIVSFDTDGIDDSGDFPVVTAITNLTEDGTGYDVTNLTQDVTAVADLGNPNDDTVLDSYTYELVQADITLDSNETFGYAGSGYVSIDADTTGTTESLVLRVTNEVQDQLALHGGCTLTVGPSPLWRFGNTAQLGAWSVEDISAVTCSDTTSLDAAVATSDTEVELTFERNIDASSITDASTQFTITPTLAVSGATVDGNTVTLTTDAQTGGTEYTVEVANSVQDAFGAGVDSAANTADFFGFVAPAQVVINEVNGNIGGNTGQACDLVELRVISGGSLNGFQLTERGNAVATFGGGLTVATGDFVVVHFDANETACNPNSVGNELTAVDEISDAANYDTAWDWWTDDGGITNTDNVLTLDDPAGNIVDAVFLASDAACATAAGSTEGRAATMAAAGEWTKPDGTQPADWVDGNFCANAVTDLDGTAEDASGASIQRNSDTDNNHKDDWTDANTSTWGALNTGQTAP